MTSILQLSCLAVLVGYLYLHWWAFTREARNQRRAKFAREREFRRNWQPAGFNSSVVAKQIRETREGQAELAQGRRRQTGRHTEWVRAVRRAIRRSSYFESTGAGSEME